MSGKIDKYKYFIGKEILPSDQGRIIEKDTFTYSSLEKAFEKQIKTIENQGEKEIKAIEEHRKKLLAPCSYNNIIILIKFKCF